LERSWGLGLQADVIARAVRDRKGQAEKGVVIGMDKSSRVLV